MTTLIIFHDKYKSSISTFIVHVNVLFHTHLTHGYKSVSGMLIAFQIRWFIVTNDLGFTGRNEHSKITKN